MLEQMRKQSQSAIILLLFGFIIFVFVFSFGAGSIGFQQGGCGRTGLVAVVNGEEISETDFQYYYEQALRNALAQRDRGKIFGTDEKLQLRRQVLDSMVDRALLIQSARRIGLHVSDQERNENIKEAFRGEDKHFDFKRYKFYVTRYLNTSMVIFEEAWRQRMLAERMAKIVQDTARVTEDEMLHTYRAQETKINLEFVKVPATLFMSEEKITDEAVAKFLDGNMARVEAFYKSHESRYHKPKKVQVAHVFRRVRPEYDTEQVNEQKEQAELTVDDLKKGMKFEEQVKQYSQDDETIEKDGVLPMLNRDGLVARWGEAFANAAFALKPDEISDVVKSEKGYHVIKCVKIIEAEDHPLEEVKQEIAREILVQERTEKAARTEAERLFAGVKAGKKLKDLLPPEPEKAEDKPSRLTVDQTGMIARMGGFIPKIGMDEELAQAAFDLTKDNPVPDRIFEIPSPMGPKTFVVFVLIDRVEPDMNAFPEAKKALENRILAARRNQQLTSWLDHKRKTADIEVNQALLADVTPPGLRNRR